MGCSRLLLLVLVLNVAHSLEIQGQIMEITSNITGVLGEEVELGCRYLGDDEIISSLWKRQIGSTVESKRLAGFINGRLRRFDNGLSVPNSTTDLTVTMKLSSVELEGGYICEFSTDTKDFSHRAQLTILARPAIEVLVSAETLNGTHYQLVSCSAVGGRPTPQISWVGISTSEFTEQMDETPHPNGTSTLTSVLRLPTHLLEEESVTCVVQHPTLNDPRLTTVRVETYARPNVTIKTEMVQRGGGTDFWVVSCDASGGRPDADISLALSGGEEMQREDDSDSGSQTSSFFLPAAEFEGQTVTCVFDHPKFTRAESRVATLPTFYLTGVQLVRRSAGAEPRELQEGQTDAVFDLEVIGNVPRYNISCTKDDGPLPDSVQLAGSTLAVQGPVENDVGGLYECVASYHHHRAELQFNVTVKPQVVEPVPPTIRVDLRTEDGYSLIECSAADAFPAANMSWLLPEGVSGVSWFNFTSHNGSHSIRGVLLLPACPSLELTAKCVINHPAFEKPENRSITLPLCARTNITVNSSAEWRDGAEYTEVVCWVESVAPAATITWLDDDNVSISDLREEEPLAGGLVSSRSSARFLSSLYSGQILACVVEHPSLEAPERRAIRIPAISAPLLRASVLRAQDPLLWLAVCDLRGGGAGDNLAWVLPKDVKGQTSLHRESEGRDVNVRLVYQFPLALHEGQDLTCVYHYGHGLTEKRTVHIPKYHISYVKVLNSTTQTHSRYGGGAVIHRLALQENVGNQRILLQVVGNVPEFNLICQRSDGSIVNMKGLAMVFPFEVTENDEGLYTCQASFNHHTATVNIQVEVTSEDRELATVIIICVSSTLALGAILYVAIWVLCKRAERPKYKKKESLAALMEPEGTNPASKENTQLIKYSIVIDVKSAV